MTYDINSGVASVEAAPDDKEEERNDLPFMMGDSEHVQRAPVAFRPGEDWKRTPKGIPGNHRAPTQAEIATGVRTINVPESYGSEIDQAIKDAAKETHVSTDTLKRYIKVESGGDPTCDTGQYQGLLQLKQGGEDDEFNKYGGGDIHNAHDNVMAGARKIRAEAIAFHDRYGSWPTTAQIYMIHQQGPDAGAAAHWDNPNQPAWQSMASTGEGQAKGAGWSQRAIWENVPDNAKGLYSPDTMTSKQFTDMWSTKIGGGNAPVLEDVIDAPAPNIAKKLPDDPNNPDYPKLKAENSDPAAPKVSADAQNQTTLTAPDSSPKSTDMPPPAGKKVAAAAPAHAFAFPTPSPFKTGII